MKKLFLIWFLSAFSLSLMGCGSKNNEIETQNDRDTVVDEENNKTEEFVSYYDNWAIREVWTYIDGMKEWTWITYDEGWNVIEVNEYQNWELVQAEEESNILSVKEENILSTDELKALCEKILIETPNTAVTWADEMLFINTYGFKGITKSDWPLNNSPVYCNVTHDWVVLDAAFYLDEWQTIEELHKQLDYTPYGNYPTLKKYYWFVGNIILWNIYQTTYITWKNTMYFDNSRWIALKLWAEFDGWLIREIDTDEGWIPHSEIIFLIKWDENEENRTGINWYREMFTIAAISKENLVNFWASLHDLPFKYATIWENNQYYFVETNVQWTYSDLIIFDVEEY